MDVLRFIGSDISSENSEMRKQEMTVLDHDPDFPKPGLYCEVDSVQSLADSMANSTEKSIYEPSWPSEAFRTRYVLDFDHEDRGYAIYHMLTRVPDRFQTIRTR